jgi:hypothetical protein
MSLHIASRSRQFAEVCLNVAERSGPEDAEKLRRIADVWLGIAKEALTRASRDQKVVASGKAANDNRTEMRKD